MRALAFISTGTLLVILVHAEAVAPRLGTAPRVGLEKLVPPGSLPDLLARNKDLIPTLVVALKDPDPEVRMITAFTLTNLGKDVIPVLVTALADKDRELRANAAWMLGQFGKSAQDALPALLKALKDEDAEVRRRAMFSISRIVEAAGTPLPVVPPVGRLDTLPTPGPIAPVVYTEPVRTAPKDPGLLRPPSASPR